MIDGLEPVSIQELRALGGPKQWTVEGHLDQLHSLTPVRGQICAEHKGNVLAVEGEFETIVTLCCDRCLSQFNHQLKASPSELIWLGDAPPSESELQESEQIAAMDGLVECLNPSGDFTTMQWVFEQLNLQMPVVNHCGEHCPGPPGLNGSTASTNDKEVEQLDPRWQALRRLQSP